MIFFFYLLQFMVFFPNDQYIPSCGRHYFIILHFSVKKLVVYSHLSVKKDKMW